MRNARWNVAVLLRLDPIEHARARQHRLTASRAADLMTGSYKTWNRLAWDMRGEQRILGQKSGVPSLDWGVEHDVQIRAWVWERHPEWSIENGGLLLYHDQEHPLFAKFCACSPDGIILPNRWGLEVKAPYNPDIHLAYARSGELPTDYVPQVQYSLWCSGYDRWLFASGDPRIDDDLKYTELAVRPDPAYQDRITELATEFLEGYSAGDEFQPRRPTAAMFNNMF